MSVRLLIASEAAKEVWGLQPAPTGPTVSLLTCRNGQGSSLSVAGGDRLQQGSGQVDGSCTGPAQLYASPPQDQEYSLQGTPISSLFQGKV